MSMNPIVRRRERCREARELLSDYLDAELDRKRQRAVERHLRWCPKCDRTAQNLSRTIAALHQLRRGDALGAGRQPRTPRRLRMNPSVAASHPSKRNRRLREGWCANMSDVITLTEAGFDREVTDSELPVLVDYWAPWCGPCRALEPVIEAIAAELEGRVRLAKVNVDEEPALAARAGVQSIPRLVLYRDGAPAAHSAGARPKAAVLEALGLDAVASRA